MYYMRTKNSKSSTKKIKDKMIKLFLEYIPVRPLHSKDNFEQEESSVAEFVQLFEDAVDAEEVLETGAGMADVAF